MTLKIDKATIEFVDAPIPYLEKPSQVIGEAPKEQLGSIQKFRVTTLDTLNIIFGIVTWPAANPEVRFVEFVDGLEKYKRLQSAGKLMFIPQPDGKWLAELNVMKIGDGKDYATLHSATLAELSQLAKSDITAALVNNGAIAVDTRAALVGETNRQANRISMLVKPDSKEAVAVAFTITRVLAIMNDFGQNS